MANKKRKSGKKDVAKKLVKTFAGTKRKRRVLAASAVLGYGLYVASGFRAIDIQADAYKDYFRDNAYLFNDDPDRLKYVLRDIEHIRDATKSYYMTNNFLWGEKPEIGALESFHIQAAKAHNESTFHKYDHPLTAKIRDDGHYWHAGPLMYNQDLWAKSIHKYMPDRPLWTWGNWRHEPLQELTAPGWKSKDNYQQIKDRVMNLRNHSFYAHYIDIARSQDVIRDIETHFNRPDSTDNIYCRSSCLLIEHMGGIGTARDIMTAAVNGNIETITDDAYEQHKRIADGNPSLIKEGDSSEDVFYKRSLEILMKYEDFRERSLGKKYTPFFHPHGQYPSSFERIATRIKNIFAHDMNDAKKRIEGTIDLIPN